MDETRRKSIRQGCLESIEAAKIVPEDSLIGKIVGLSPEEMLGLLDALSAAEAGWAAARGILEEIGRIPTPESRRNYGIVCYRCRAMEYAGETQHEPYCVVPLVEAFLSSPLPAQVQRIQALEKVANSARRYRDNPFARGIDPLKTAFDDLEDDISALNATERSMKNERNGL